jgi:hypothetical protein
MVDAGGPNGKKCNSANKLIVGTDGIEVVRGELKSVLKRDEDSLEVSKKWLGALGIPFDVEERIEVQNGKDDSQQKSV